MLYRIIILIFLLTLISCSSIPNERKPAINDDNQERREWYDFRFIERL